MPSQNAVYENINRLQGLEEQDIESGNWNLYKIDARDSERHAGETCAIPSQINVPWADEAYDLLDNGAIISTVNTKVVGRSFIAARAILEKGVAVNNSVIGRRSWMHEESKAVESKVDPYASIGARTILFLADIGSHTEIEDTPASTDKLAIVHKSETGTNVHIGKNSSVVMTNVGDFSTIGKNTKTGDIATGTTDGLRLRVRRSKTFIRDFVSIGDNVMIARGVSIGSRSTIEDQVIMRNAVNVGFGVKVGKAAIIGGGAKLEHHANVKPGKTVKTGRIVKAKKPGIIAKLKGIIN